MEISIFAKKRQTKDGRPFYIYLTTLHRKDGTEVKAQAKFSTECDPPKPESCPCNIIVDKENCNFSSKTVLIEATGELVDRSILWIKQWANGSEYVDHSMDDFA